MKRIFTYLQLLVIFSFVFVACEKEEIVPEPIASFTLNKTTAFVEESISFGNTSQNAVNFSWDFGDGTTSTGKNPVHAYNKPGTYTISLTVIGEGGISNYTQSVTITYPSPIADFTANKETASTNEILLFTNASQYATIYLWDFGDGVTSTEKNPSHFYTESGNYTVTLSVSGEGGTHTFTRNITITVPPNPLLGKWILLEGYYNGSKISGITGYFEFKNDTEYYAKIDKGSNYARASSFYSTTDDKLTCTMPDPVILNGMSMGMTGDKSYYTSILMTQTEFTQIGATSIGYDNSAISFSVTGNTLTLESSDGKTLIRYTRE